MFKKVFRGFYNLIYFVTSLFSNLDVIIKILDSTTPFLNAPPFQSSSIIHSNKTNVETESDKPGILPIYILRNREEFVYKIGGFTVNVCSIFSVSRPCFQPNSYRYCLQSSHRRSSCPSSYPCHTISFFRLGHPGNKYQNTE